MSIKFVCLICRAMGWSSGRRQTMRTGRPGAYVAVNGIDLTVDALPEQFAVDEKTPSPVVELVLGRPRACHPASTKELAMREQSETLREAVGVFTTASDLQAAIDELLSSGFHRAELSLLAGEDAVNEKLGGGITDARVLEDDPAVPRSA